MHEESLPSKPTLVLRFDVSERAGKVRVFYGTTDSPHESGFEALRGWERIPTAGVGFPTLKCEVESERPGYRSIFGWIQVVTQKFPGSSGAMMIVDRFPAFLNRDIPFASLGYSPSLFDAPAFNSLPAVDWRAATFLCTLPLMETRETILPLVGFTWGYRISRPGGRPIRYPLQAALGRDWRRTKNLLRDRHPKWRFASRLGR